MKNLFGKIASLAFVLGVAVSLSSCHKGLEGETPEPPKPPVNTTRTLQVVLSKAVSGAKVYYGTTQIPSTDSKTFKLEDAAANGLLTVNLGSEYVRFSPTDIAFGSRQSIVLNVDVIAMSASKTKTEVVAEGELSNDNTNRESTDVIATLSIDPSSIDDSGATGSDYSMTVYSNPVNPEENVEVNTTTTVNPLSVLCQPDGVTFTNNGSEGAVMALYVEGSGLIGPEAITIKNDKGETLNIDKISNDTIYSTVKHFSIQNLFVNVVCTDISSEGEEPIGGVLTIKAGDNELKYNEKTGYRAELTGIGGLIVKALLGAEESTVTKKTTIKAEGDGTCQFFQERLKVTFQAGQLTMVVYTYGAVTYASTSTGNKEPESVVPTPTHGGGSNDY